MKAKKSLLALTNEFLENFFIEAHRLENEKNLDQKDRQSLKETKSYSFGYLLSDCLMESNYVIKENHFGDDFHPLIEWGLIDNLAKSAFNLKIKGSIDKIEFVIANIDKQDPYSDYRGSEPTITTETYIDKLHINPNFVFKRDKSGLGENDEPFFIDKEKTMVTKIFTINNSKSGRINTIGVVYKDDKFDKYFLKETGNNYPILTVNYHLDEDENDNFKYVEEGTFSHYKYISEINSFYSNLEQVIYSIKDILEENKR